jgi:hypothetical protein
MVFTDSFSPASGFASRTIFLRVPKRYSRCRFLNCGNPGILGSPRNLGSLEKLRSHWTDLGL